MDAAWSEAGDGSGGCGPGGVDGATASSEEGYTRFAEIAHWQRFVWKLVRVRYTGYQSTPRSAEPLLRGRDSSKRSVKTEGVKFCSTIVITHTLSKYIHRHTLHI